VWQNLEGTIQETNNIESLFSNKKISTIRYSGIEATEEAFKSFSNHSPSVMHIATHGFYFAEDNKFKNSDLFTSNLQFTNSKNPLLRSGILLAGGNKVWTGEKIPSNIQDGVLSAYEVSQLNLLNTKLVVLSACQTGLGESIGNEGVYGLQRAFKIAGVDNLIVSLWEVPDATTQELMQNFYSYWLQGKTINQAFKLAQNDLKKKYSAYGWAAFVLIY
jgi:CHAT domain-containing protein